MANVVYEGENVLKYELDGPTEPLGSNENDRYCKSINGEAPDEVELWDRNDPGPEGCCEPLVMSSAKKPLKVDGQLQVDGRVENPVGIFNPEFGVYSKKPVVADGKPVTPGQYDTSGLTDTASYWIGTPDGNPIPLTLQATPSPDDPTEEIMVLGVRRRRRVGELIPNDIFDAGKY